MKENLKKDNILKKEKPNLQFFLRDLTCNYGVPVVEDKNLGGVIFSEKHEQPETRLYKNKITVYLKKECERNADQCAFQLAHEAVHVFFYSFLRDKTRIIEEGLAVHYSLSKSSFKCRDQKYKCSYVMFKKLNDLGFSIKKARKKYPKMCEWTFDFLYKETHEQNIKLNDNSKDLLTDLTKFFYKMDDCEWDNLYEKYHIKDC